MKTSCIIIDDEPDALKLLENYISETGSFDLKGQFSNAHEALTFLRQQSVDVIFTDIDMPGMSGLELASVLPPEQKFIFITEHEKYALDSFRYRVVDYLLKPFSYGRFLQTTLKVNSYPDQRSANTPANMNYLFAKSGGKMFRINFNDILYIKGEKEYVGLHFKNERLLIYKRMKDMEDLLPTNFRRIHTSYIINMNHLIKVANKHVVAGTEKIPISSTYRSKFREHIDFQTI